MPDAPSLPAAPAAPAAPASPSITFGGGAESSAPETKVPAVPEGGAPAITETPDKFEFKFDGDEESYSFEERADDAAVAETYDASKPFDPAAEAALKDHPEILKALKQGHYELRQWKANGFKNPNELKGYKSRIEALGGPEAIETEAKAWADTLAQFSSGDPAVIDKWSKENPDGLAKLSGPMLDWLSKSNPGLWGAHMGKVFMATLTAPGEGGLSALAAFNQLYDIPEIAKSPAAMKLLKQMADTINGVSDAAKKGNEPSKSNGATSKREHELAVKEHGLYLKEVNTAASPLLDSAAKQAIKVALKGLTISKDAEADILADVKREFNRLQKIDPTFQENARDLLTKKDTDRFLRVLKSAIARNMPRAALREARKYKGLSGNNAQRRAEGQTRVETGGGGAAASSRVRYTGPMKQGGPDPAQIDYQAMRGAFGRKGTDEMLSRHEFFKKGGDGKTIYFW